MKAMPDAAEYLANQATSYDHSLAEFLQIFAPPTFPIFKFCLFPYTGVQGIQHDGYNIIIIFFEVLMCTFLLIS